MVDFLCFTYGSSCRECVGFLEKIMRERLEGIELNIEIE